MKIIVAHSIRKKEFSKGRISSSDLGIITKAFAKGISIPIKGKSLPKNSRLVKLYVTTVGGAKRMVFLVDVKTGDGYLLFFRGKNDAIEKNISIKNPLFQQRLVQYLQFLDADMQEGQFTVYSIE